uniref:SET domain-containing protein n=1 Tax=Alexandrium monilatum TaxID=311494 RepID=A0A7S4SS27_9DINO
MAADGRGVEEAAAEAHLLALHGGAASPGLPARDFCHAAVRLAPVADRGRGLVLTAPVPAGALLLACRPLALAPRADLQQALVKRLQRCPEADYNRFLCLYEGGQSGERALPASADVEALRGQEKPDADLASPRKVDAKRVERVIRFNAIARDSLDEHGTAEEAEECGLWLLPSFLNHSCRPNAQLTFLGEWLVCRSAWDLQEGQELRVAYVSTFQPLHVRRPRLLDDFGFECCCERCVIEELLLLPDLARPMLQKLDTLVDGIDGMNLKETVEAFEKLVTTTAKLVQNGVKAARSRWQEHQALRDAATNLWGQAVVDKGVSEGGRLSNCLQRLLSGSFLPAFFGTAFAYRQLDDPSRSAEGYRNCLELLEEVCAGSAYHAHWAAERALQAHQHATRGGAGSDRAEVAKAAQYARHWNEVCHGREACDLLLRRHGWPEELLQAAPPRPPEPPPPKQAPAPAGDSGTTGPAAAAEAVPAEAWGCSVEEAAGALVVSLALPDGVELAEVDLDVAPEHLEAQCHKDSLLPPLRVLLPRKVDPSRAPPAKFKKRGRRVILELPLA